MSRRADLVSNRRAGSFDTTNDHAQGCDLARWQTVDGHDNGQKRRGGTYQQRHRGQKTVTRKHTVTRSPSAGRDATIRVAMNPMRVLDPAAQAAPVARHTDRRGPSDRDSEGGLRFVCEHDRCVPRSRVHVGRGPDAARSGPETNQPCRRDRALTVASRGHR